MKKSNYELIIQCNDKSIVYPVDWIEEYNNDAMEFRTKPISESELVELNSISYHDLDLLNGIHIIYGVVECFEQSDCPYWYKRDLVRFSWKCPN